jgi:hypothetical protein
MLVEGSLEEQLTAGQIRVDAFAERWRFDARETLADPLAQSKN